ncbi:MULTISPECIES: hypothetical protein [Dyadobacter]|jgi:hypothetical protein|uniref:Uncharacterized protein n=1 Tax=Dyadobacter chenhuakuii TaxID=2909339 RepID=A0A9X1QBA2_9BACT|nr:MULTISPECIES: hypothetical protein [Dyadobacter]MCE7063398.1 hypothetical protein [Dyadobacter sp. CY343]MCF2496669.1 hypothetical protein [Dyadobacter chenhuakuii]
MKTIATLLIAITLVACEKKDVNPEQQILGKWEEFYLGNGEYQPHIVNPPASWHFLPDSVLLEYEYATKRTIKRKYWIDTLLNIGTTYNDGNQLRFYYTPKFYADTMELRAEKSSPIFSISKWKRIN